MKKSKKIDYIKLQNDVRALGSELYDMGCSGKHCALIGKLSYDWAVLYFSIMSINAVVVPLDKDWNCDDLADTCKNADIEYIFADESISEKTEILKKSLNLEGKVYSINSQTSDFPCLLENGEKLFESNPEKFYSIRIDPSKMSLLVVTSGTTGKGKGVMLSQNAILSDLSNVTPYIDFGKKTVGVLPPHHTYGSSVLLLGHVMIGAEVYISGGMKTLLKELKDQKPEHLVLVPLFMECILKALVTVEL